MAADSHEKESQLSRRDFTRKAAAAATAAVFAPIGATSREKPTVRLTEEQPQAPPSSLPREDQAEVDARIAAALRKHGDQLSSDQKTDIRRLAAELQKPIMKLRAYPLENSSQPATVLSPIFEGKPVSPAKAPRKKE
jgi:hypothetical protein